MCGLAQVTSLPVSLNSSTPKKAAKSGQATQVPTIFTSDPPSVGEPVKRFQPMIAPTMA